MLLFFFFKQKTAYEMRISDWSSDVCSSDLVASVAPDGLRTELLDVLAQRCRRISLACTQARFGAVWIAYPRPSRLGVDRFLALLGAHARGVGATMVVGVGTALTVAWLDAAGRDRKSAV